MKVKPLAGYVLIKDKDFELDGGFVVPESNSDQRVIGEVLDIGEDKEHKSPVKIGDVVVYKKYSKDDLRLQGEDYRLIEFDNLVATIEEA